MIFKSTEGIAAAVSECLLEIIGGFALGFGVRHMISQYRRTLERRRYLTDHPYLRVVGDVSDRRLRAFAKATRQRHVAE